MTTSSTTPPSEEETILARQARNGYTMCFSAQCPKKEQCLRWKVGRHLTAERSDYSCINPLHPGVATAHCPRYRSAEKATFARGMTGIFTDDMPQRVEKHVRRTLIARHNRAYYFEYRNGKRLITPALQEEIRTLFRQAGWQGEVRFDSYTEDYEW